MNKSMSKSVIFIALAMSVGVVNAKPFDGRQDAMGGTGVSGANYKSGALYNPALVAKFNKDDDLAIILPTVGVEGHDKDGAIDNADDVQDAYDGLGALKGLDHSTATDADRQKATDLSGKAATALRSLDGKTVDVEAGVNMVVAIPSETVSVAVHAATYLNAHAIASVSENDFETHTDPYTGATVTAPTDKDDLESFAVGYAAATTDIGVTLAKGFDGPFGKQWFGVTPKFQRIDVANITSSVADDDSFDNIRDYQTTKNGFNVDLGYATELPHDLVAGVAVKNAIPQKLSAPLTKGIQAEYTVSPVVTTSLTWNPIDSITLSGDVDLTPAKHFTGMTGVNRFDAADDDVQMVAVGAEYNLADWIQIRGGYKQNLVGNKSGMVTAGLGISPFDVFHIDLAGSYGGSSDVGATLQTSLTF